MKKLYYHLFALLAFHYFLKRQNQIRFQTLRLHVLNLAM